MKTDEINLTVNVSTRKTLSRIKKITRIASKLNDELEKIRDTKIVVEVVEVKRKWWKLF